MQRSLLWGGRIQARPFLLPPGGIPHLPRNLLPGGIPHLQPDGRIRARPNQTFRHSGPGEAEASLPGNRILPIEPAVLPPGRDGRAALQLPDGFAVPMSRLLQMFAFLRRDAAGFLL